MSLLRTFIAVDIPPHIQTAIQQGTGALRKEIGPSLVRWAVFQNLHLTLKFLGDVAPANLDMLTRMLRAEADSCAAFDLQLNGIGSFPSLKRPRVIYIGIQAPAALEALQHGIESAAAKLGYEPEARPFSPHLTIGRVRQDASTSEQQKIRRALEESKVDSLGTARVNSVQLYKSDLKPGGAVYTQLFSAPLRNDIVKSEAATPGEGTGGQSPVQ